MSKVGCLHSQPVQTSLRGGADPSDASASALQPRVLLAQHDPRLASFVDRALAAAGYSVERTADGLEALDAFERAAPDVVLLDPALPGFGGLDLARELRSRTDAPILLLSAHDTVEERVAGLDAGADDYLSIPFAIPELLARLRAVRRGRALASASAFARSRQGSLSYADLTLDLDAREVFRGERRLELRNKAFELLTHFLRHPERVLSRRELLEDVWGYDFLGDSNVIEVTVSGIRQALELDGEPRLIHTVRPIGYILNGAPAPSDRQLRRSATVEPLGRGMFDSLLGAAGAQLRRTSGLTIGLAQPVVRKEMAVSHISWRRSFQASSEYPAAWG